MTTDRDPRPDVLMAMGLLWEQDGQTQCHVDPEYWHPSDSLDDVRLVEEWLHANWHGHRHATCLNALREEGWLFMATAAERWQACLSVMREAKLIPKENERVEQ